MVAGPDPDRAGFNAPHSATTETLTRAEHLLRVAAAVTRDAHGTWAEMWAQFKPHVTPGGVICPEMEKGFVPACGWAEFLEKYWLLKHYLDSMHRLCTDKR